jgi:hypothetical protein
VGSEGVRSGPIGESAIYDDVVVGRKLVVAGGCHQMACDACDYGVVRVIRGMETPVIAIKPEQKAA